MRALVLSGGGPFGRYQEGACRYLLGDERIQYDLVVGNSVGAINGAGICMFPKGEEKQASEFLTKLWLATTTDKVHKRHWPFGYLHAYSRGALRNTQPLHDMLKTYLDGKRIHESNRRFICIAVDLISMQLCQFEGTDVPIIPAVMGSAAFPGFFPPVERKDKWLIDGGVRRVTPLSVAIEAGAECVDVVVTGPKNPAPNEPFSGKPNLKETLIAALSATVDQIMDMDLKLCRKNNLLAQHGHGKQPIKLNIIRPEAPLADPGFMEFDPTGAGEDHSQQGYHDAIRAFAGE